MHSKQSVMDFGKKDEVTQVWFRKGLPWVSIDVFVAERWYATLRLRNPWPLCVTLREMEDFVVSKRPTLRRKDFRIVF